MENSELDQSRMPLWQHLDELRTILVKALITVCVGMGVTYYFCEPLVHFLEVPLLKALPADNQHLYFTGVADKFFVYLKISILTAVILVSPLLLYFLWTFVSPALLKKEKRFAIPFLIFGTMAFFIGIAFAYYGVLPYAYQFLINFGGPSEKAMITLTDYFDTTLKLMLGIGLVFEMPVILVLLARFGIVSQGFLNHFRRHAYVASAVLAAVITPTPDAFTMLIVLVPLILLYEASVVAVKWVQPKGFVVFFLMLMASPAFGSYRAYELKIVKLDPKGKEISSRVEVSTLDPAQYSAYNHVEASEKVELNETWFCPGDTSRHKICEKPKKNRPSKETKSTP